MRRTAAAILRNGAPKFSRRCTVRRIYDDNRELFYREGGCSSLFRVLSGNLSDTNDYFDLEFNLKRYPQARECPAGALRHFIEAGIDEWLCPNLYFDPRAYVERYPDAPKNSVEALRHFIETGDREARTPSSGFDPRWYLRAYPDAAQSGMAPLRHFLVVGRKEGRRLCDSRSARDYGPTAADRPDEPPEQIAWDEAPTASGEERYQAMRDWLADRRRIQIGSFAERDIRPVKLANLQDALQVLRSVAFPVTPNPKVSILIPCHNEFVVTVKCLLSIRDSRPELSYVIGDNASTESGMQELAKVPGLR
ncbi:MAG TPA: hypothetical protein VM755_09820 [Stellaceae bacterium]|nr:hypothetical protein [Stellaceae bacterium]